MSVPRPGQLLPRLLFLFLYISCGMCLFWEFHNKMTVIYHYQPLYHLVNKRPLTFSLSFPPSRSGSQISVLVPPASGRAVSKAKSWSAMAFWLNCVWRPQAEKVHTLIIGDRERKRVKFAHTHSSTSTRTHTNKTRMNRTTHMLRVDRSQGSI